MEKKYVVITEIYFERRKISRERKLKVELDSKERNQLIRTLFNNELGKMNVMDIYSSICISLKEKFQIDISERTVMRVVEDRF